MVICMGATFIIILGSIDLSIEGILAITGVSISLMVANDFSNLDWGFLGVPIAIGVGGFVGFLNGYFFVIFNRTCMFQIGYCFTVGLKVIGE